ncbi:MAG: hypothetical protein IKN67_03235 [Alphaproteobacteria bacterium]|nr:hypothetical protein [Alphaproteobacteria bacterium]
MTEENKAEEKEPKFVLDKDSVDFLQSQLNATINPELKDDSDYYRAVFYFKCCGLKNSEKSDSLSEDDKKLSAYYQTKDRIDALFENIYEQALKFQDAINTGDIPYMDDMEKMNQFMSAGMAAQTITTNEMLSEKLHSYKENGKDDGNAQLMNTISFEVMREVASGPDFFETLDKNYNAMKAQAVSKIAPYVADIEPFMPVIEQNPKSVLALGIAMKANQEAGFSVATIKSPEDMKQMCRFAKIAEMADNISFKNMEKDIEKVYNNVKVTIGLSKQNDSRIVAPQRKVLGA